MRAHDGPGRLLLRDGRQPRQLSGQPVLGIRQARQDQGKGLPHLLVLGRRPALAALVATRELYTVVPLVIEPRGSREQRAVGAGAMSTALTEGGLRQMRPGSLARETPTGLSSRDVGLSWAVAE